MRHLAWDRTACWDLTVRSLTPAQRGLALLSCNPALPLRPPRRLCSRVCASARVRRLPAGSERKAFNNDVRALVEARYGRQPFELQLETKVYCLEKVGGRLPCAAAVKASQSVGLHGREGWATPPGHLPSCVSSTGVLPSSLLHLTFRRRGVRNTHLVHSSVRPRGGLLSPGAAAAASPSCRPLQDSEGDVDPNRPVIKPVNQQSLFGV